MTTKAGERLARAAYEEGRWPVLRGGGLPRETIERIEAEAVRDALTDLSAAVKGLEERLLDDDGDGYGGVPFVGLASVLREIDKRTPGGAT